MKPYALYARVSTLDKQTNLNQLPTLIEYVNRMNYEYDIYEEQESTRKTLPIKAELMKKLRMGMYEGVIIVRLDRWGRSLKNLVLELDELIKKDIKFISINDNLNFSTAIGKFNAHLLMIFSEYERSLISERTRSALERISKTRKLGRPVGAKDKRKRKTDGYLLREYNKKIARANNSLPNN